MRAAVLFDVDQITVHNFWRVPKELQSPFSCWHGLWLERAFQSVSNKSRCFCAIFLLALPSFNNSAHCVMKTQKTRYVRQVRGAGAMVGRASVTRARGTGCVGTHLHPSPRPRTLGAQVFLLLKPRAWFRINEKEPCGTLTETTTANLFTRDTSNLYIHYWDIIGSS